jgi:molecular chaperone DnaK
VSSARIVGIDLGTSNSCIALHVQDKPEIIHSPQGDRTTPSVVAYIDAEEVLVGVPAARQAILNPKRTVTGVKRLVGQCFDSEVVSSLRSTSPYEVVRARNGDAWVAVGDRELSPQEIQSYILSLLRTTASAYCGLSVDRAVVTVPAFFDETQRQAVRDAAEIAGLEAVRLLNEPTAVALAHGYGRGEGGRVTRRWQSAQLY